MNFKKASLNIENAIFPAVITILSFIFFIITYYFVTVKSVEPYYLIGLIFGIPAAIFSIITYYTAKGILRISTSAIVTIILIIIFGIIMFVTFIFISIDAATTITTDIARYERVLKLMGYPENSLIKQFPAKIPNNAEYIVFSYSTPLMQGGEIFNLGFKADSDYISKYVEDLSVTAKWIGKINDDEVKNNGVELISFEAFGYDELPEDFTIYLLESKPQALGDWNHGSISLMAINQNKNEIIFVAEDW